jgi:hypothetical protein
MIFYIVPSLADEMIKDSAGQKDKCLLVAQNCGKDTDSVQQRISRLKVEIAKGTDVYTTDELNNLKGQLKMSNNFLHYLQNNERPTAGGDL